MATEGGVEYGKLVTDYSVDELKALLQQEETRLSELKDAMMKKRAEKEGEQVDVDQKGNVRHVTDEAEKQRIKSLYDLIDTDGSGGLGMDEFARLVYMLGVRLSGPELLQAYQELDSDGDGDLRFEEFLEWWQSDIHRSRYKGTGLAKLKGRLGAKMQRTTKNLLSTDPSKHRGYIRGEIEIGDYSADDCTEVRLALEPGTAVAFKEVTRDAVKVENLGDWMCHPAKIGSDLWLSYKAHAGKLDDSYLAMAVAKMDIVPGKEAALREQIARIKTRHLSFLSMYLAQEGVPEPGTDAHDVLATAGVALDEEETQWSPEHTQKFREICHRLGKHMDVQPTPEGILVAEPGAVGLDEDSDDATLLRTVQWVADIDQEFMFEAVKLEVVGSELHIKVLWVVELPMVQVVQATVQQRVAADPEEYIRRSVGDCFASLGIGGDVSQHMEDIFENDAAFLDMLGWGIKGSVKADFGSSIIEQITREAELGFVMGGPLASRVFRHFTSKVAIRNPYSRVEEIIRYLVEDARVTLANGGGDSTSTSGADAYVWDDTTDAQLREVHEFAQYIHEATRDKLRLSNPAMTKLFLQAVELAKMEDSEASPWPLLQSLRGTLGAFKSVKVHTAYLCPEVTVAGGFAPVLTIPTDAVVEKAKAGKLTSNADASQTAAFKKKWKDMKTLTDAAVMDARFGKLIHALDVLDRRAKQKTKKRSGERDGVLFVNAVLMMLKDQSFLKIEPLELLKKFMKHFDRFSS